MRDAAAPVLARFGIDRGALIGSGGESEVFALDATRVVRVRRRAGEPAALERLAAFLARIDGRLPYGTPLIEAIDGQGLYTVERRLPGRPMTAVLPALSGDDRRTLLRNYLEGAEAIGAIDLTGMPYGRILDPDGPRSDDWHGFFRLSLDRFIATRRPAIPGNVAALREKALALLDEIPAAPPKALVHGDYFPGNVLIGDRLEVSGLVDFSVWTLCGDPAVDIAGAALFLEQVSEATAGDVAFARATVLARHGEAIIPFWRFFRAYCAFALASVGKGDPLYPKLAPWSRATFAALAAGTLDW